jgi:alpha-L-fucosidase
MKVNSEAIYGTRPWKIFGEGPGIQKTKADAGMNGTPEHFNENQRKDLSGSDIRFTTKANALYAFSMGHNTQETRISALSPSRRLETRKITRVELLGSAEPLQWKLSDTGLAIASPQSWSSEYASVFKIYFESGS